jgi:anthranilate phosphoribosyltransferase
MTAGAVLVGAGGAMYFKAGAQRARELIRSGLVREKLDRLVALSRELEREQPQA